MRLVVELSEDAPPETSADELALGLHALAGMLRSPRRVSQRLRDRHYKSVEVRHEGPPLSALQGLAQLVLVITRADCWSVDGRTRGRASFAGRSLVALIAALCREIWWSLLATTRLLRASRRSYALPRTARTAASALYLRVEPSLRWRGVQVGGAATHTSGVINGLAANGVDMHVLAPERPAGVERAGFTPVRPRRLLQLVRGLGYADYADEIVRAASSHRADFVYQRYQMGSYAGLEIARRRGAPLVLEFNGPEVWVERHWRSGRRLFLERALQRLEDHHLHESSLVVVVSDALRAHVVERGVPAERVLVNPNGVDIDLLAPYRQGTTSQWRRRAGLPEAPTVGFIGTFGPWHGAQLLPELIARVSTARWVLVGGGGLVEQVRDEIAARGLGERVTMPGVVAHERALELLAACEVCVSPHVPPTDGTQFFGSPTKLFEYMGLAKAIVASDLEQIGEVIEHERSGLLCPPGDVRAAASAVNRLLADEGLRTRLGVRALERAVNEYSWEAHARRIVDAIMGDTAPANRDRAASVGSKLP